jgi:hypothetical protein
MPFYTQIHMLVVHEHAMPRSSLCSPARSWARDASRKRSDIRATFSQKLFDRVNGRIRTPCRHNLQFTWAARATLGDRQYEKI